MNELRTGLGIIFLLFLASAAAQEKPADAPADKPNFFIKPEEAPAKVEPRLIEKNVAEVGLENTAWDAQRQLFKPAFRFADDDPRRARKP